VNLRRFLWPLHSKTPEGNEAIGKAARKGRAPRTEKDCEARGKEAGVEQTEIPVEPETQE